MTKPMTNLGNRRQISAASGLCAGFGGLPAGGRDDRQDKGQTPIQTSRPTTFISVKDQNRLIARAGNARLAGKIAIGLRGGETGRIGKFDVPIQASATPVGKCNRRAASGKAKIITIAQKMTMAMADRRMLLFGADRAGDGDGGRDAAYRAARP